MPHLQPQQPELLRVADAVIDIFLRCCSPLKPQEGIKSIRAGRSTNTTRTDTSTVRVEVQGTCWHQCTTAVSTPRLQTKHQHQFACTAAVLLVLLLALLGVMLYAQGVQGATLEQGQLDCFGNGGGLGTEGSDDNHITAQQQQCYNVTMCVAEQRLRTSLLSYDTISNPTPTSEVNAGQCAAAGGGAELCAYDRTYESVYCCRSRVATDKGRCSCNACTFAQTEIARHVKITTSSSARLRSLHPTRYEPANQLGIECLCRYVSNTSRVSCLSLKVSIVTSVQEQGFEDEVHSSKLTPRAENRTEPARTRT